MSVHVVRIFALVAATSAALFPTEPVPILSQDMEVNFDGTFHNSYETGNGIIVQEQGYQKPVEGQEEPANNVQGSAQWTAPDGTPIQLNWTANENGAQFSGSHLPKVPPAIQAALDFIATKGTGEEEEESRRSLRYPLYMPARRF